MADIGNLAERVPELVVHIGGQPAGQLRRHSVYEFRYARPGAGQQAVSLLMPPSRPICSTVCGRVFRSRR